MLNVLHLWKGIQAKTGAGGGIAMYRLHCALRNAGIDSRLLCQNEKLKLPYLSNMGNDRKIDKPLKRLAHQLGLNDVYKLSSFKLKNHKAVRAADILHLHGTHHGFINYLAIPSFTKDKPTVFTLHDMWLLTGHCAISYECEKWKTGCGHCPHLNAPPVVKRDNTRIEFKLKKWVYNNSDITFVAPCTSLYEQAKQSMLNCSNIEMIPHGLDTSVYRPIEKNISRDVLGLPQDKKILMFAAVNLNNHHKGSDLLMAALKNLPESLKNDCVVITIGEGGTNLESETGLQTFQFGLVNNEHLKALIYSAADTFISPTRGEAFGLTILESMACGTPVVAFGVGGVLDLVRPDETGYLAEPESADDLNSKIIECLEDRERLEKMMRNCVAVVDKEYKVELQAERYLSLYKKIT